tara:strand:- start:13941 stop:14603 length:663 start_codon:yes stop_codon:yes gene_type:complete
MKNKYGLGTEHVTNNHGTVKVVMYRSSKDIDIEFLSTGNTKTVDSSSLKRGTIKDSHSSIKPEHFGVGYVGEGKHLSSINGKQTLAYSRWRAILRRCYCPKQQKITPQYIGCTVATEWYNFQNFAEWFTKHYIKGMQLDKDIIIKGNREYSPDKCIFVTPQRNTEDALAKTWYFTSPDGEEVEIYNLAKFCRENSVDKGCMGRIYGAKKGSCKGWRPTIM